MAPDVTVEECVRLARAMTLKNAAAGLPHGGAKSVIAADPAMPAASKEQLVRAFAAAIRDLVEYIPGPDMGTDEQAMAWVRQEAGRAVGLPRVIGGIPLDEIGATGFGLAVAGQAAEAFGGPPLRGARVAVQGFGAVGQHAARFLLEKGAVLVAVSDSRGGVVDPDGLDLDSLIALKQQGLSVDSYGSGKRIAAGDMVSVPCDIWIPAARPDVLRADNVASLDTKLVLQGANIPATPEAEAALQARGIICIPDFIANAGGVICASVEFHGGSEQSAFSAISEKISRNTTEVLRSAIAQNVTPRAAANHVAAQRVRAAMSLRRWK